MNSQASVLSQIQSASAEEVRAVLHALCADDADVCRSAGGWFEKHKRVQEARDRAAAAAAAEAEAAAAAAEAAISQQQRLQLQQQHLRQIAHSHPTVAGPSTASSASGTATGSGHDVAEAENIRAKKRKLAVEPAAPKPYIRADKCINCGLMFDEELEMNAFDAQSCWHHRYQLSQSIPLTLFAFSFSKT